MLNELLILTKIKAGDIKAFRGTISLLLFSLVLVCGKHYRTDGGG